MSEATCCGHPVRQHYHLEDGRLRCRYCLDWGKSSHRTEEDRYARLAKAARERIAERWPTTEEQRYARLAEAAREMNTAAEPHMTEFAVMDVRLVTAIRALAEALGDER